MLIVVKRWFWDFAYMRSLASLKSEKKMGKSLHICEKCCIFVT